MVNRAKIQEWANGISDSLNEQQWFQELRGKWDELDPQSKTYLKFAVGVATALALLFMLLSAIWQVHSLRTEYEEKTSLVQLIQNAHDEIRRLREAAPSATLPTGKEEAAGAWLPYFESTAESAGIDRTNVSLQSEKAGQATEYSKEALIELGVKHVNLKQLVHWVSSLESGRRPVKLRNLVVDTQDDPSGYLNATLALSAFTPIASP